MAGHNLNPLANLNRTTGKPMNSSKFDRQQLTLESQQAVPEAYDTQQRLLVPIAGSWATPSTWSPVATPVDGTTFANLPILNAAQTAAAVESAAKEFRPWSERSLSSRASAIAQGVDSLRTHRDLLVHLLAWEIGKTIAAASNDVDRCIGGIDWYLEQIGPMLEQRRPLGLISNIASWNYPFSVLLLNVLVQILSGNAAIAKIPTLGGGVSLTLAVGLLKRAGLPISLVGGRGQDLTQSLVAHPAIAGLAFVGGRANGTAVAQQLRGTTKRYALEMEGVNTYSITAFTNWDSLGKQIRAGFDFGKQRCTAYTRWVVERSLVPTFLDTYINAVSTLRVGHPLLGLPVDFGPLISPVRVKSLRESIASAKAAGAEVLYQGRLADDAFTPDQDRASYMAPTLLCGVKTPNELYLREPFAPIDVVVPVDSEEQLIAEANVSGGALVASVATDDTGSAGERISRNLQAFKVGINKLRSRGDKEEEFGGLGRSWEGAFVGGENLVRAFTDGPQPIRGNWQG